MEDDGAGRRGGYPTRKRNNTPLILSAVGVVVMVVIVIVAMSSKGGDDEPNKGTSASTDDRAGTGAPVAMGSSQGTTPPTPTQPAASPASPASPGSPAAPAGSPDTTAPAPAPEPPKRRPTSVSDVTLKDFPWLEAVDVAIREQAETHLEGIRRGGRDQREAEKWFQAQGRPVAGRLIAEFKRLHDQSNGWEDVPSNIEFKSITATIDTTLRSIDGVLDRTFDMKGDTLRHTSTQRQIMLVTRRWTYWWEKELWKTSPLPPWDPFADGQALDQAEEDARQDEAARKRAEADEPK